MLCVSIPVNCNAKYRDEMSLFQGTTVAGKNTIIVRPSPLGSSRALVQYGNLVFQAAIGLNGRTARKREGDGKTPITTMALISGFYRDDRGPRVKTALQLKPISNVMLWCDAPKDPNYNQLVRRPLKTSHEEMCRSDGLYDICLVLDWNVTQRKRGAGSAIFMHLIRPGYQPTAGCIALHPRDMRRLLPHLNTKTRIKVV